jgi:D-glycero-alpha-D-manno-heptose-7-phosphate kinase
MIISRTPLRVSLFGGGSDLPGYFIDYGGAVLGGAIDRYVYCSVVKTFEGICDYKLRLAYRKSEYANVPEDIEHPVARTILAKYARDQTLEITITADLPARVGLGSSSAVTVGLINVVNGQNSVALDSEALARKAIEIERDILKEPGGWQDQIFAAYGGFNFIRFSPDKSFVVTKLGSRISRVRALENHLMLYFTGVSRDAGKVEQIKVDQLSVISTHLAAIRDHAYRAFDLFESDQSLDGVGTLLHETWLMKRALTPCVSNPHIDRMYRRALDAGALGGKLLGAGAGGFLLLFCPLSRLSEVETAMRQHVRVPFSFEDHGSTLNQF